VKPDPAATPAPDPGNGQPDPQLVLYARDLRVMVLRERQKSAELAKVVSQLHALTGKLEHALTAERERSLELEQAHHETLVRLLSASRIRDEETGAHIQRVSRYSHLIATLAGLNENAARVVAEAAPMHDVGKIGVPDRILRKRGPLNADERVQMEAHALMGAEMLQGSQSPLIRSACEIALTHHERWDGSGYPRGLRGDEIPIAGRIVMLADQYDALRSERPYKRAYTHAKTMDILIRGDGRTAPEHFDPLLLQILRDMETEFERIYAECTDPALSSGLNR